jgi:hypothetical protein
MLQNNELSFTILNKLLFFREFFVRFFTTRIELIHLSQLIEVFLLQTTKILLVALFYGLYMFLLLFDNLFVLL